MRYNTNHVLLYPKIIPPNTNIAADKNAHQHANSITPKLHSLIHFTTQIRQFGAPRYSWCFRYESKNAPFKKIMRRNCNYHNVPWSMASHHQKLVGLDITTDGESHYFRKIDDYVLHNHNSLIDANNAWWASIFFKMTGAPNETKYRLISKITISGRICESGTVFLRELPNDEKRAVFFRIRDAIVCDNDAIFFIMEEMETHSFCHDRFSFIVHSMKSFVIVSPDNLTFDAPLHSFFNDNELHVVPNYYHML